MSEEPVDWYGKIPKELRKVWHNPKYQKHKIELPARIMVIAASGGGKTTFALQFIHDTSGTFEHIAVCVKSKHEPLYEYLAKKLPTQVTFYENTVVPMSELEQYGQSLVILDDLVNTKALQTPIAEMAIRGRKKGITIMYLTQSYYAVPKLIRLQMNYLIIKKVSSEKDLKLILREQNFGINLDQLMELYKKATADKKNWLMIDVDHDELKFRNNYTPIHLKKESKLQSKKKVEPKPTSRKPKWWEE